jgi:tetratricopeptide (TPR) repeat protein
MTNVAKLKERARTFEQKEQWKEALDVYQELVGASPEDVEVGLWNRIGDLHLRIGQTERAVDAYERAVSAYAEVGLHNNAIALCRKVLRIAPARTSVYLKLGQISAAQGFLADARQNFLEYAQRMQRAGELDASFAALKEFADLSPEDTELRLLLAEQLRTHGREGEAVEQLRILLGHLRRAGEEEMTEEVVRRIQAIDPAADATELTTEARGGDGGFGALDFSLGELSEAHAPEDGGDDAEEEAGALPGLELHIPPPEDSGPRGAEVVEGLETAESYSSWGEGEISMEGGFDLPLLDEASQPAPPRAPEAEAEPIELQEIHPISGLDPPGEEPEESAEPLPFLNLDEGFGETGTPPTAPPEPAPDLLERLRARVSAAPEDVQALQELLALLDARGLRADAEEALEGAHRGLAARGMSHEAIRVLRSLLERRPGDTTLYQKQVEYAFRAGDVAPLVRAYLDLGRHLGYPSRNPKARAVYQRVLELDPANEEARRAVAAPADDYVDLGALILEDEEEATTRFVVPEEEPTGDEDRDFADMLAVFRQKVSENIGTEDSSSHYDLGLAFMEMGLIDEAISEFQVALRGGANPLATLEVLGHCFMEKGQYAVASRVLERAVRIPGTSDAELIGVVYQLGRCEQAMGNAEAAREHYERVVALDIRFRDAAVRLEELRAAAGPGRF